MSQKKVVKVCSFCLDRNFIFREFGVVKTLQKFENLLKCRKTPARFFNCRKTLVEKPRLDPDSSMLKLLRKKHKQMQKSTNCRKTPARFFTCEKTLRI